MYVEVNGASIFFDVVGSKFMPVDGQMVERPTLLLLHGGPGFDHSLLRPFFDRFADTLQVIYIDQRGNGRSGGGPETWTLAHWAEDIHGFCQALGIVRPILYGQSFGGMVAMAYAARYPDGPAKLILSSTAAKMDLEETYRTMERLGGREARDIAVRFWSTPTPEAASDYMRVCMRLYNPGAALSDEGRARSITRPEVWSHFIMKEQRTMDLREGLGRVVCPTLVLAGDLDPITPVSCGRAIVAALPPGLGQLVVFGDAGHGVHRDEPDRAEAVLRRFLGEDVP